MKISKIFLILIAIAAYSCHSSRHPSDHSTDNTPKNIDVKNSRMWVGVISKQGMTFYQYGSHVLEGNLLNGNPDHMKKKTTIALTSDTIDLDKWLGKEVIVTGTPIEGYPVEGGPLYVNVLAVEKNGKVQAN